MSNETEEVLNHSSPASWGVATVVIFAIALIGLSAIVGYGYFNLSRVNASLVETVTALQQQVQHTQNDMGAMQQTLVTVKEGVQAAQQVVNKDQQQQLEARSYDESQQVSKIYMRLVDINNSLDQLPVFALPLKSVLSPQSAPVAALAADATWWENMSQQAMLALNKIVIVRQMNTTALPLALPEEKLFLYQNLHAQMEAAMWAVLHHSPAVYQASLQRAITWIQRYFVMESPLTLHAIEQIQEMQRAVIPPPILPPASMSIPSEASPAVMTPSALQP